MPDVQWYGGSPFAATITPSANDGAALGTTVLSWSDLFLAAGGVINWNDGDITLTEATDLLTFAGGQFALPDGTYALPSLRRSGDNRGLFFDPVPSIGGGTGFRVYANATDVSAILGAAGSLVNAVQLGSTGQMVFTSLAGATAGSVDTGVGRNGAAVTEFNNGTAGTRRDVTVRNVVAATGFVEIMEQALPAAGEKASCRIFVVDNAAGKRSLRCIFGSGAAQIISTEP